MSDFEHVIRANIDSRIRILPNGDLRLVFSGRRLPVVYRKNPGQEVIDPSSFKDRTRLIDGNDHT